MERLDGLPSDEVLLEQLRGGSREAFEAIYQKYWSNLYLSAYNILRDRDTCKDVLQEVFVKLWTRKSNVHIHALGSYLHTAVRFKVLTAVKNSGRKVIIEEGELERLAGATPLNDSLTQHDIHRLLDQEIAGLPRRCREVFVLSRKEHLSNKEIARRLGITPKTVENQITLALQRIRTTLGDFLFWAAVSLPVWEKKAIFLFTDSLF